MKNYSKVTKDEVIRLHLKEGRTIKSLTQEYHLGSGTLQYWLRELRKECQNNPYIEEVTLSLEESKRLILEIRELKKENEFLKKAAIQDRQAAQGISKPYPTKFSCNKTKSSLMC